MRAHWRKELDWADRADAQQRFEKKYYESLGDNWREELAKRKQAQFDLNPVCAVCNERIENIDGSALWEPTNQSAMLLCTREECFTKTLQVSLSRYMVRGRRANETKVVEQAETERLLERSY